MSHRTKIQKLLRQAGFVLVRKNKHFIYKNETGDMITLPNHNKMNQMTFKHLKKRIEMYQNKTGEVS